MTVSIDRVKDGVACYLDKEVMSKATGLSKWFIGAGLMALPNIIDRKYHEMKDILIDMGITDSDDNIDIEEAERILMDVSTKYGKITETIGGLRMTLCSDDVQAVMSYIKSL